MRIVIGKECPGQITTKDTSNAYLRTPYIFAFDESKFPDFDGLARTIELLAVIDGELKTRLVSQSAVIEAWTTGKPNEPLISRANEPEWRFAESVIHNPDHIFTERHHAENLLRANKAKARSVFLDKVESASGAYVFTEEDIWEIHNAIYNGHNELIGATNPLVEGYVLTGQRRTDKKVIRGANNVIELLAPHPEMVGDFLGDYFEWFNNDSRQLHPIAKAIIGGYIPVAIQPADAGNHSVARIIQESVFTNDGLNLHRMANITENAGYGTMRSVYTGLKVSSSGVVNMDAYIQTMFRAIQHAVGSVLRKVSMYPRSNTDLNGVELVHTREGFEVIRH